MSFSSLMNNSALVESFSKTSDGMGGYSTTSDTVYAAMPCRWMAITGDERPVYGAERQIASVRLYAPATYMILETYRITVDSAQYDVLFVNEVDKMGRHLQIDMVERNL